MFLALCEAECGDELICDFAQYYHILNHRELDAGKAAVLCFGLREDSRVKSRLSGQKLSLEEILLARIADENAFQSWSKTKDGQKNRNRPKSVLKTLLEDGEKKNEGFESPEDFNNEWEKIIND